MTGLEAVDLRNGARNDDAHGIRHVVFLQRLGDRLGDDLRLQTDDIRIAAALERSLGFFLSGHNICSLFGYRSLTIFPVMCSIVTAHTSVRCP